MLGNTQGMVNKPSKGGMKKVSPQEVGQSVSVPSGKGARQKQKANQKFNIKSKKK